MKTEQSQVTVNVGDKEYSKAYTKELFEAADVLEWLQSPEKSKTLLVNLNYGHDLKAKAKVRNEILNAEAGPEKVIDRLAKDLIKMYAGMGRTLTPEKAVALAKKNYAEAEAEKDEVAAPAA